VKSSFYTMASAEEERQATVPQGDSGSAIYSPIMLSVYDAMVLGVSNRYIWRCSTDKVLLPLFESAMSERHLDIGDKVQAPHPCRPQPHGPGDGAP